MHGLDPATDRRNSRLDVRLNDGSEGARGSGQEKPRNDDALFTVLNCCILGVTSGQPSQPNMKEGNT